MAMNVHCCHCSIVVACRDERASVQHIPLGFSLNVSSEIYLYVQQTFFLSQGRRSGER